MAALTRPESQTELAVLCEIEHQLPLTTCLGDSGNQVTADQPGRWHCSSDDDLLDLPFGTF